MRAAYARARALVCSRGRSYAFIEFASPQQCEQAYFKMNNVLIDDRRIHVDFSQSVARAVRVGTGQPALTCTQTGRRPVSHAAKVCRSQCVHSGVRIWLFLWQCASFRVLVRRRGVVAAWAATPAGVVADVAAAAAFAVDAGVAARFAVAVPLVAVRNGVATTMTSNGGRAKSRAMTVGGSTTSDAATVVGVTATADDTTIAATTGDATIDVTIDVTTDVTTDVTIDVTTDATTMTVDVRSIVFVACLVFLKLNNLPCSADTRDEFGRTRK